MRIKGKITVQNDTESVKTQQLRTMLTEVIAGKVWRRVASSKASLVLLLYLLNFTTKISQNGTKCIPERREPITMHTIRMFALSMLFYVHLLTFSFPYLYL